jgi:hypothetical protein
MRLCILLGTSSQKVFTNYRFILCFLCQKGIIPESLFFLYEFSIVYQNQLVCSCVIGYTNRVNISYIKASTALSLWVFIPF